MLACAILEATAHLELKNYDKGIEILESVDASILKEEKNEDVEKLLLTFSLLKKDDKEAKKHAEYLYQLNEKTATEFIVKILESS